MELRDALFKAIERCEITGKELSQRSDVSEAQISRFRKGGDISFKNFQKLVNGLPRNAYHQFASQLLTEQMNSQELADLIMVAVYQLKGSDSEKVLASSAASNN